MTTQAVPVLLKCGHSSHSVHEGKPCCVVCFPSPESMQVSAENPDLKNRIAKCTYCQKTTPSEIALEKEFLFTYAPDRPNDRFYCGCKGWD